MITNSMSICLCDSTTGYYIASGVIIGCIAFAAVVLAVIVVCLCYVHKEREKHTIVIDVCEIYRLYVCIVPLTAFI